MWKPAELCWSGSGLSENHTPGLVVWFEVARGQIQVLGLYWRIYCEADEVGEEAHCEQGLVSVDVTAGGVLGRNLSKK